MFAAKVAEKILVGRLLIPFGEAIAGQFLAPDDRFRDVDAFIAGERRPSLGGIVRLLRQAANVRAANWHGRDLLQNLVFINKLQNLANVRNNSAHVNESSADEIVSAISIVVDQGRPGDIFKAIGIELPDISAKDGRICLEPRLAASSPNG